MKIVCVMDSVSRANGGIFEAERRFQQMVRTQGDVSVEVLGLWDEHTNTDSLAWSPIAPVTFSVTGPRAFGYVPGLAESLDRMKPDVAYSVGLWKYPSIAVLRWARRSGKPYLVAPHGMLDAWALRHSGARKKVAAWLFQDAHLRGASCLRALCASEAEAMRAYGLTNPVAIIPNGIDLPDETKPPLPRPAVCPADKKVLLYLGRLHPKKGLISLLGAWRDVRSHGAEWILAIAGWEQSGHEVELKQRANWLGITNSVRFLGPQFGEDKAACYRACEAFVLPSLSEGLPMAVLEAWAYAKPVLMTPACHLPEGLARRAAFHADPTRESLANGLRHLFAASSTELQLMGRQGRVLVEERFAWPKLATEMAAVFRWISGSGPRPDCVAG